MKEKLRKGAMQYTDSFNHPYLSSIASKLAICMGIRLKENLRKGAMQHTDSFNHPYLSSIASKLAIRMGIEIE